MLLGLMMMKSSKKWLTMSWLAEFLVGLLWSNLPLMTCYLRSCLSSIWAKKNLLPLALPAVKLVWKSEFFNWKKILPPFSLNLEPNFVKSASFNHSQHTTEEDERKKSFLKRAKNVFFSARNVLNPLLSLYMYFFIPKVLLKDQKMLSLRRIKND